MIFLSIGLAGGFSDWVDAAIAALLGGDTEIVTLPEPGQLLGYEPIRPLLDDIGHMLIASRSRHLVIGVRQPDEAMRTALAANEARFVLALDHPRRAVADLITESGTEPTTATRAVANSCATVMRLASLPGALLLHADTGRGNPAATIAAIGRHLGLPADTADHGRIAAELAEGWTRRSAPDDWAERLPAADQKTLAGALVGYEECFAGRGLGQLIWSRDLFIANDPVKRATELLDIAGGARILVFGPYIHLPPGSWTAQVTLGLSAEAAGCTFLIDAYAGGQLAAAALQPSAGGIFMTEVNFALTEASREPVEIRVTVLQDHATGRLAFGRVVLHALESRRPDSTSSLEDFESALGL